MARFVTLANGVRYMLDSQPRYRGETTIVIAFGYGAGDESRRTAGRLHLIEHMFMMRNQANADLYRWLDAMDGEVNAAVSEDLTMFYLTVPFARHVSTALHRLADMVLQPHFTESEFLRERQRVLEEMSEDEDSPELNLLQLSDRLLFNGHALGTPVIGYRSNVEHLSYSVFTRHWKKLLNPTRITISVAGRFDRRLISQIIRLRFSGLQTPTQPLAAREQIQPAPNGQHVLLRHRNLKQVHFHWIIRVPGYRHRSREPLRLLANILAGRNSSPLWLRAVDQSIYDVSSESWHFPEIGYLRLSSVVSREMLWPLLEMIAEVLRQYRQQGIPAEELIVAKRCLAARIRRNFDKPEHAAHSHAAHIAIHSHLEDDRVQIKNMRRVRRSSVNKVAAEVFWPIHYFFAALGSLTRSDRLRLRRFFKPTRR